MIIDRPSPSHIPALRALWREAFGDGEDFLDVFERTAFSCERCRCVIEDNTVTAALYWFDCSHSGQRVAYLYAIATAKEYRGRGLCTSLMEDTHRHLRWLGYVGALLVPAKEELFGFYEKLGYSVCTHIGELRCPASEHSADIRQIGADEYARLRRELLPEGGVIQENENLKFLQTQAELYATKESLLAARREGDILCGAELLGNTDSAPAIVRALGCAKGRFRVVGKDKPFAMYRPLNGCKSAAPTYFGLAFD